MKRPRPSQDLALPKPWPDRFALLLIVVIGGLAYSTALTSTYAHMDDYTQLGFTSSRQAGFLASQGRAVGGCLFATAFWPVATVQQLWIPRLFSICGVVGLALAWWGSLRRLGYGPYLALLAGVVLLLLPPFLLYAAWAAACNNVYGALVAVAAFWCVHTALQETTWSLGLRKTLGGIALLVVALNIYQPTAMFYVTMMIAWLLSPAFGGPASQTWRRLGEHLAALVLALGVSYLLLRLSAPLFEGNSRRAALDLDLLSKASWFLEQPLAQSFLVVFLWGELSTSYALLATIAVSVMSGTVLGLFWFLPREAWGRGWRMVGAMSLLPLTYLPSLVVTERWASFRSRGALAAAVALLVILALAGLGQWLRRWRLWEPYGQMLLLALLVLGGVSLCQSRITNYFVIPFQVEWRAVRYELAKACSSKQVPKEIVFLMPTFDRPVPRQSYYDEFGHLSTGRPWVPEPMCRLILRDIVPGRAEYLCQVPVTLVPPGGTVPPSTPGRWVIDARSINMLADRAYPPPR